MLVPSVLRSLPCLGYTYTPTGILLLPARSRRTAAVSAKSRRFQNLRNIEGFSFSKEKGQLQANAAMAAAVAVHSHAVHHHDKLPQHTLDVVMPMDGILKQGNLGRQTMRSAVFATCKFRGDESPTTLTIFKSAAYPGCRGH